MHLMVTAEGDVQRDRQEQFVRQRFAAQYGAEISHFLPALLSIETVGQELQGVVGINPAAYAPLFLEQYLDQPVESSISTATTSTVKRNGVVEVGNLASVSAGGARMLIVMLTAYLHGADYQWVTFTALPPLINSFRRLGIPTYILAEADPNRLENGEKRWGRYFEGQPKVIAVEVSASFDVLERAAIAERLKMVMVWTEAYSSGQQLKVDVF